MHPTTVDLHAVDRRGTDGAVWSLPHGGDLDANLVRLGPGGAIGAHVNNDADVLIVGVEGAGCVTIDSVQNSLRPGIVVAVPKTTTRSIHSHAEVECVYLTVHRARAGVQIRR
jgi:mannose-6-phosphate isomerase-like protein (cupin superfamily)